MDAIAPWLSVLTGLLAFATAAIGVARSMRNSTAIHSLEVKVDGRLTELLAQSERISVEAQKTARLLGREEARAESDTTAAHLARETIAATLDATREKPVAVDVVSSIPIAIEEKQT